MSNLVQLTINRARKERLPQLAGSLTFTTLLSIVPLLTVSFALVTRFPAFKRFEAAFDEYFLKGLLPADLSLTVVRYMTRFAANASGLTWVGSLFLLFTSIAMLLTVENAFNRIWQVRKNRLLHKRIVMHVLMLAVGPPVIALSLWATSYVLGMSIGLVGALPRSLWTVLDPGPLLLTTAALTGLFYFVPNTAVRLRDAVVGGLIAGVAIELGKRGFAAYLVKLPTYKAVYGTFAAVPLFLLWIYFSWLVTLVAAMIASSLASTRRRPTIKSARA
jgi:membrane protein